MAETYRSRWLFRMLWNAPLLVLLASFAACSFATLEFEQKARGRAANEVLNFRIWEHSLLTAGSLILTLFWVGIPARCIWSDHLRLTESGLERVRPWPFGAKWLVRFDCVARFGSLPTVPGGAVTLLVTDTWGTATRVRLGRYQRQEELLARLVERIPASLEPLQKGWWGLKFALEQANGRKAA